MTKTRVPRRWSRSAAALLVALVLATAAPAPAASSPSGHPLDLAQMEEMQSEGGRTGDLEARKSASRFRYLMLGYGLIWAGLAVYLVSLNRGIAKVGREIDELKTRLEEAAGGPGGSGGARR